MTYVASLISQTSYGCYYMFINDEKVCRASYAVQSLAVGEDYASTRREKEGPARGGKPVDLDEGAAGSILIEMQVQIDGSGTIATSMSCIRQPAEHLLRRVVRRRDDMQVCDAARRPAGEMVG